MKIPEPYVWWVKIKDVPGAPTHFELRRDGSMWATTMQWDSAELAWRAMRMTDELMRSVGYEKCFCDPQVRGEVADGCPAHASACI